MYHYVDYLLELYGVYCQVKELRTTDIYSCVIPLCLRSVLRLQSGDIGNPCVNIIHLLNP